MWELYEVFEARLCAKPESLLPNSILLDNLIMLRRNWLGFIRIFDWQTMLHAHELFILELAFKLGINPNIIRYCKWQLKMFYKIHPNLYLSIKKLRSKIMFLL